MIKIKSIVLAAGYGTRLYPLTHNTPKPLLKIGKRPIIEHILYRILEVDDIDGIYIVTNDKFYPHFVEWKKHYHANVHIKIISDGTKTNEDRLGAIGDIDYVVKQERIDDDLLVIAGDNLFEFSLRHLNQFFHTKEGSVVALYDLEDETKVAGKYGVVQLGDNHQIIDFEEKPIQPKSSLASTACYIFSKEDVEELERCIAEHKKPDNSGDFIKYLAMKKKVFGFVFTETWFDIGSHEQLKEADEFWSNKE